MLVGVLYNKSKTKLIYYPINKADTSYKIIEGVTSIEEYAFFYCQDLENIEIPSSVKSIGTDAFASCKNLKKVKISNGITSIGDNAFANYYFHSCICCSCSRI